MLKVTGRTSLGLDFDNQSESEEPPITEAIMNLRPDADLLRGMIGFARQRLMELEYRIRSAS